jgi:polyphosphate kinase
MTASAYINRELSWLEFNRRVLEEAQDPTVPLLAAEGVRILRPDDLDTDQRRFLDQYFRRALLPVVTPLAIDPGHPFPHLANRSLCLVASIRTVTSSLLPHTSLAVVHIPGLVVPRFVALPAPPGHDAFVLLEDVIRLHLPLLYNGYEVISCHAIRVTRDAEFEVKRGRADDLLTSIEQGFTAANAVAPSLSTCHLTVRPSSESVKA